MTTATACAGSGRIVSAPTRARAIYTGGTWVARCPVCGRPAPFALAETRPDAAGYRRRYGTH